MHSFYFSPKSTTKRSAEAATAAWGRAVIAHDLLKQPLTEPLTIPSEEAVLVAMPVYAGRIPAHCGQMLRHLKGSGGPAVAMVVFGNRAYDDALLELCDLLKEQGFHVVAAGAFVGRHSIFPKVGASRPDGQDQAALTAFGEQAKVLTENFEPTGYQQIQVKGDPAYRNQEPRFHTAALLPEGNQNCIKCRACVSHCPMKAISPEDPKRTDSTRCISCGACIYICPVEARGYWTGKYQEMEAVFTEKCAAYVSPETFFA